VKVLSPLSLLELVGFLNSWGMSHLYHLLIFNFAGESLMFFLLVNVPDSLRYGSLTQYMNKMSILQYISFVYGGFMPKYVADKSMPFHDYAWSNSCKCL